jgi:hypothetical protein
MTFIIELILGVAAGWCAANWLMIFYWWASGQITPDEAGRLNDLAFKFGLCAILSLGFLGLLLK